MPGLWNSFDCGDIGALVAPRAMLIETGMSDRLNSQLIGMGNVITQYEIARQCYSLCGAENKLSHWVTDGGHGGETGANVSARFLWFIRTYLPLDIRERRPGHEK